MKRFLSIVGACILSLSMLVGCGAPDTKANETAGLAVTSNITTLTEKIADLDADSQAKFQEVATKVQSELPTLLKELEADPTQENVDKITAKYEEYNKELKAIGDANGIELKDTTDAAK